MNATRGAAYGASVGFLAAVAVIGLPIALAEDDLQVEWLGNILFVAFPLILLGILVGAFAGDHWRRPGMTGRALAVMTAAFAAIALLVAAGTTSIFR